MPSSTATVSSFSNATVYTARDFTGYTLQYLKAMYPNSWSEAAHHFGVALPELTVEQIKQIAIEQKVWDFYPTTKSVVQKMLTLAQLKPHYQVLEPSAGSGNLAKAIAQLDVSKIDCFEINSLLQKALKLQKFNLIGDDFLASIKISKKSKMMLILCFLFLLLPVLMLARISLSMIILTFWGFPYLSFLASNMFLC
jgi:hypothetical protein